MADNADRQPTDELRLKPVLDEVAGRDRSKDFRGILGLGVTAKSDRCLSQSSFYLLLKTVKRSTAYEQNMARVDNFFLGLAATLKVERRLKLGLEVHWIAQRDLGFLHQLQERCLNAATAYIPPHRTGTRRDLVDFVYIDDSILGKLNVAVGLIHQVSNKIFDVTTDIARFAELCRIRLHEGDTNQIGNMLDQISLANSGRSQQQNIPLTVFNLTCLFEIPLFEQANSVYVVIVIAYSNRKRLLGFLLLDYITVKMRLYLLWCRVKLKGID